MPCTHELWDMETACADGMCPLCLAADLARVRAVVAQHRVSSRIETQDVLDAVEAALEGRG